MSCTPFSKAAKPTCYLIVGLRPHGDSTFVAAPMVVAFFVEALCIFGTTRLVGCCIAVHCLRGWMHACSTCVADIFNKDTASLFVLNLSWCSVTEVVETV